MRLRFMERRLKGAEFINKAPKGPDIRLGVISLFLHKFGGHVIRRLPSELVRYPSKIVKSLTPTYVFAKLACARAFDSPKSPSLTVLFASRKTMICS